MVAATLGDLIVRVNSQGFSHADWNKLAVVCLQRAGWPLEVTSVLADQLYIGDWWEKQTT